MTLLLFTEDPVTLCATFSRRPRDLVTFYRWRSDLVCYILEDPVTYMFVTFYRWPSDLVCYSLQRSSDIRVCYILQITQWPTCGLYFTDHLPGGLLVLHFTDRPVTYLLWAVFHRLPGDLLVFTDHPVTYLYNTLFYYERRLSSVPLMKRRLVSAIIGQCLSHFVSRPVCVGERRPQAPGREVLVWMDIASLECVFEEIWPLRWCLF